MKAWKESLQQADRERTLARAKSALGHGTRYVLGKGGRTPADPMERESDCSGFVAWAIGIPRELPPGSGRWLQTTTYWKGGGNVGSGLFNKTDRAGCEPGDLYVYPDVGRKQGHMGIISRVQSGQPVKVIHCSKGNDNRYDDAICETDPDVFARHPESRIMKVDYMALRALFDIPEPGSEAVEIPAPRAALKHPLFAEDATLQLVATGDLVIAPTGHIVDGCGPIQEGLNRLAEYSLAYYVELGENRRYRGYYGPKTKKALMNFQRDMGLPITGNTDSDTLLELDATLMSLDKSSEFNRETVQHSIDSPLPASL